MHKLSLTLLPAHYAVCRLDPGAPLPAWAVSASGFLSLTRTADELSVVCEESQLPTPTPAGLRVEAGWSCFKIAGPLDFSLVGVLASLTGPLADADVSIFAISTFDTDYVLVRSAALTHARQVLTAAGHSITNA